MNRAGIAAVLAAALGIAACAGTGPTSGSGANAPPGDVAAAQRVSGTWRATGSQTGAGSTLPPEAAGAFIGTTVEISPQRVVGVRGNRCDAPVFAGSQMPPGDFFGGAVNPSAFGIAEPTAEVITVTCDGAPFDRFLRLADGTLVTGFNGAFFRLEQAGAGGTASAAPAAAPPAATAPARVDPAHAAHLASYRHGSDAERGWQILSGRFPELRGMTPVYTNMMLPGRGMFNRLLVVGPSDSAVTATCLRLRQAGQYCAPMPLESAASRAASRAEVALAAPAAPPAAAAPAAPVPAARAAGAAAPPTMPTAAPVAAAGGGASSLTRDYLAGIWGLDGVAGCNSGNVLAFYPEGSVRLYNRLGGMWHLQNGAVQMVVQALDPNGAVTEANVAMEMRPIELRPDGFRATFTSRGQTAEMAAARCPR